MGNALEKSPAECRLCAHYGNQTLRADFVFGDSTREKAFFECGSCGLIYMYPSLTPEQEAKFYAKEFEKFMEDRAGSDVNWTGPDAHIASNAGNVTRRWEKMQKFVKRGDTLLEIGCSSGFMLDKFSAEGINVVGIEPSGGFSKHLDARGYKIFKNIDEIPEQFLESFDVVCHFFVLEHISDTKAFIEKSLSLLKPGGILFCEVPSATDPLTSLYTIPEFERFYWSVAHHYYFTPATISTLLDQWQIQKVEIIPEQRYDLSNHITWMMDGKPGGQGRFDAQISEKTLSSYRDDLISQGFFDTFFLKIQK